MQKYGVNELRRMFLEYFESKGHLAMKSFSLVPHNDKSLLLINSGMAPMKTYFTGEEVPPNRRITTCQKCIRTGDIDNVGKTSRHGTFFEMLGNFSFGDYFKKEAIEYTWEFLTDVVGLEADRLYPSIYENDDEAWEIWHKDIGIAEDRIYRFGKKENFWEHGSGPCGPCSEVYYDRGEQYGCGKPTCTVGCDCDRYIELWNDVFSQYDNDGQGHYTDLAQKNIDTGMGLERLACIVQGVDSMFDIDTLFALREHICRLAGTSYGKDHDADVSIRIVTDHIRSVTFMISDGILPANSGRGYVLRRLLRRASRHGRLLGIEGDFLVDLAGTVIEGSRDGYPELEEKKEFILKVISKEEEQFNRTIDQGLDILETMTAQVKEQGGTVLSGADAFKLYDTYGFPVDLTMEILTEQGMTMDQKGFDKEVEAQKERAKGTFGVHSMSGKEDSVYDSLDPEITSTFVGYDQHTCTSKVTALTTDTEVVEALTDGQDGTILVEETPFYATMGGQEADLGVITGKDFEFEVTDTRHLSGGKIAHVGTVRSGMVTVGDPVTLSIDTERRALTASNHSATHLLQKALRTVLGTHVEQAGSSVNEDRLRFDFTHYAPMTEDEIHQVEEIVNEQINRDLPVTVDNLPIEEARKTGAMALFGEKYGDIVRVVSMGDFSKEFCGGTHVAHTGLIRAFKIVSETGVAAGVRRIEALTSTGLLRYYDQLEQELKEASKIVRTTPDQLSAKLSHLVEENKDLHGEVESLRGKLAQGAMGDITDQVVETDGIKFLATRVDDVDQSELRDLGDQLKSQLGECVVLLASSQGGKVSLISMATEGAIEKGAHAGNLIKAVASKVGGGGGGRPNMAQAGGKNPAGIDEALAAAKDVFTEQLT